MHTRRIVAVILLAMLPTFAGASMAVGRPVVHESVQWARAIGIQGNAALAFGLASLAVCGTIPNPGAIACGVAGAF
jgi:hypothetical protein